MRAVNRIELIGFVGSKEPLVILASGTGVFKFSLSTPEKWVDKTTKEIKKYTEWHSVVIYGDKAQTANMLLDVGNYVRVVGKNKTDKWADKDTGKKMQKTNIVCNDFILLASKEDKS